MTGKFSPAKMISIYHDTTAVDFVNRPTIWTVPRTFQDAPRIKVQKVYYLRLDKISGGDLAGNRIKTDLQKEE